MTLKLRDYQERTVRAAMAAARQKDSVLVQAPTGAGKTAMFSALAGAYASRWNFRILVLAHRTILVRQALERFVDALPADLAATAACAGVSGKADFGGRIVAASPQTLAARLDEMPAFDCVIVDECHRLPPPSVDSLAGRVVRAVRKRRPGARLFGFTATPWRLGQGEIWGGEDAWWTALDAQIGMRELRELGWLCPLQAMALPEAEAELSDVPAGPSGDFNEARLSERMRDAVHLGSAVKAFQAYGFARSRAAVFCVDTAHAQAAAEAFQAAGFPAAAADSKHGAEENAQALEDFRAGRIRVLCSVGMLAEGWDCPECDCLVMCRPTMSPALHVQMIGRGLRTAKGKNDCLLLDLGGNLARHGSPESPRLYFSGREEGSAGGPKRKDGLPRCPWCRKEVPAEHRGPICPWCGMALREERARIDGAPKLAAVDLEELADAERRAEAAIQRYWAARKVSAEDQERARRMRAGLPFDARVVRVGQVKPHEVQSGPAAGVRIAKISFALEVPGSAPGSEPIWASQLLDPAGLVGRASGKFWLYAQTRSFWTAFAGTKPPRSTAELSARAEELNFPETMKVQRNRQGFYGLCLPKVAARRQ